MALQSQSLDRRCWEFSLTRLILITSSLFPGASCLLHLLSPFSSAFCKPLGEVFRPLDSDALAQRDPYWS